MKELVRPTSDRPYWLAWHQIKGIGPHRLKRLFQEFGSLERAWLADGAALMTVEGIGLQLSITIQEERQQLDPDQILGQVMRPGIPFLTPADADYPDLLWELPDPPPIIYVWGETPRWQPSVAIVGTRSPTPYGRRWTEKIASVLGEAGFVVVSGLAAGIDGIAHQACLQAGGTTLAVVGTGVDVVYPAQHRQLYQQIQKQGAILSEFPPGTQPAKENFPRRNRIIAGLCQTTLVMEAPAKSGALITAYLANDYGRDVMVLPGNIDVPEARGCLNLIQTGASMILGIEELLHQLGSPLQVSSPTTMPSFSPHQAMIWQALTRDPIPLDTLAQTTQLDISTLASELLMMELEGWIEQLAGMRYQRAAGYR
ncbi:MAG: DNA-processing protein DprA [Cyanobacteriota bacterium]|nr:DNA-processing protein DprA [Cyanobacteriota bacterium]